MVLFDFFRKRSRLVSELNACRNKLAVYKILLHCPDRCSFYINNNGTSLDVMRRLQLCEGNTIDVIIKRFPCSDDPDYASLCANELLDKLLE